MSPDELRELLKDAGRPVAHTTSPVPVIRRRGRTTRRRRAAAAVIGVAAVVSLIRPGQATTGPAEPATKLSAQQALDEYSLRELEASLPGWLGEEKRVEVVEPAKLIAAVDVEVRPGDLIRLVRPCWSSDPVKTAFEVVARPASAQPSSEAGNGLQLFAARGCAITERPQVFEYRLPQTWQPGSAQVSIRTISTGSDPSEIQAVIGIYRR